MPAAAAQRGVEHDPCGTDRGGAPRQDREAAALAGAAVAARPAGAADGLIAERGCCRSESENNRRESRDDARADVDAAAHAVAALGPGASCPADGLVVNEDGVADGHDRAE